MKSSPTLAAAAEISGPLRGQKGMLHTRPWQLLRRSANSILGCADQAFVSATNFALVVMIGRWTDPAELGTYAIGLSILALLLATQEAIITRPYSIHVHRPMGTPAEHAFSSLTLSVLLCLAATVATGAVALILSRFHAYRELVDMCWALAAAIPAVLLREFARRFAFAHLKMPMALMIDVTAAVLTVLAVGALGWSGQLSAATALSAVAVACGVATLGWLVAVRAEFAFDLRQVAATFRQSWGLGKWFLSGQIAVQVQGYAIPWLAMVLAGATVTGVFTACASVVAFANPLIFGISNVLTPKFVHTLQAEGVQALKRRVAYDAVLLAAAVGAFCIVIFAAGDWIMRMLYPAPDYAGHGHVLAVLAVANLASVVGIPASLALAAAERARPLAFVMVSTAALTILLVSALLPHWGLLGAAYGMLAAEAAGSVGRWIAFLLLAPRTAEAAANSDATHTVPALASAPQQHSNIVPDGPAAASDTGRILLGVFDTFDRAGIRYCVSHGYEDYPDRIASDVDCIVDRNTSPRQLVALLHRHRERIGADVVRCQGRYIVLAGKGAGGSPCFVALDLSVDCELNDLPFQDGQEVLKSRRRHRQFWIPTADVEFGAYLARTIAKGTVDDRRARRLSRLYQHDAARCERQVARFWNGASRALIVAAARSGRWDAVNRNRDQLRTELRRRAILLRPARFTANKARALARRCARLWRPDGISVVLLGPDGAGKSSITEALPATLAPVLPRSSCLGFAPSPLGLLRRGKRDTSQPHGLPARSLLTSWLRLAYWLAYHMASFVSLRLALARSSLVLYDRHFVDILVDGKRYRYGGPIWMLRLLWRLIPKPDLVVLLDAPAEVLQARKQEVPFEVTARQCQAYRSLVSTLENGRIVDAAQPFGQVVDRVSELVVQHLHARLVHRFDLKQGAPTSIVAHEPLSLFSDAVKK